LTVRTTILLFVVLATGLSMLRCIPESAASPPPSLVTVHAEGEATSRGIGVVRLNESISQVVEALGRGQKLTSSTEESDGYAQYRFASGAISIDVGFGPQHEAFSGTPVEVNSISTSSGAAVLFGHRLARGLAFFRSLLVGRGWRIARCDHQLFTELLPGGPGTGISWKAGRLDQIMIDSGGSWGQQCSR
jgi:hypothetical protein